MLYILNNSRQTSWLRKEKEKHEIVLQYEIEYHGERPMYLFARNTLVLNFILCTQRNEELVDQVSKKKFMCIFRKPDKSSITNLPKYSNWVWVFCVPLSLSSVKYPVQHVCYDILVAHIGTTGWELTVRLSMFTNVQT